MLYIHVTMDREVYRNKTQQFRSRWLNIEARQLQVKQNLVKFNNFVKEKRMKAEEGKSRFDRLFFLVSYK